MIVNKLVLQVLEKSTIAGQTLRLPTQLDRETYVSVDKVLKALGGRWVRNAGGHVFEHDPGEMIERLLSTGSAEDLKKDFQFFETPADLARALVNMAQLQPGNRILEPSAGRGSIARVISENLPEGASLEVCELHEGNRKMLKVQGYRVVGDDFLAVRGQYDRIVANPPFSKQQDIDHILHMFDCLKPGGILVSVISAGFAFRENKKSVEFRDFLGENSAMVKELPEGTFKESGTMVRSCIAKIERAS